MSKRQAFIPYSLPERRLRQLSIFETYIDEQNDKSDIVK